MKLEERSVTNASAHSSYELVTMVFVIITKHGLRVAEQMVSIYLLLLDDESEI